MTTPALQRNGASVRRIVGCPGGGKTRKLSELAGRAAREYGAHNVLIASLTKTAAHEIGERAGDEAGIPPDQTATLHAHALRALEFDHERLAETPAAMREFHAAHPALRPDDGRGADVEDAPAATGGIHAQIMNHRARMTPSSEWTDDERAYAQVWADYKAQTGRSDFTDLVQQCLDERVPPLHRPRVILADEAQDFTRLEFRLLLAWAQGADSTVCVGDTQQAIYWFRGADPEALEQIPVARGESLTHSYRCSRAVADAAQSWAAQLPGEHVAWTPRCDGGTVTEAPYALRDTDEVVAGALESVGEGHSTMVLATCRYMLAPLCSELRRQGIPFANQWAQTEAAWNPLSGPGPRALLALLQPTIADGRMWTWGDLLAFTEPMQASTLARGAKASIKEHCRMDEFRQTHAGEEVALGTLLTLLGDPDDHPLLHIDSAPQAAVDWWRTALLARATKSADYATRVWRTAGADYLRPAHDPRHQAPALTVGTVHSTKGAEADRVLLCPEVSKVAYYEGWHGADPRARDALVRTMYVGMTRAREALTVLMYGHSEFLPLAEVVGAGAAA